MPTTIPDAEQPAATNGPRLPPAPPVAKRFGEIVLYARKAKCLGQRAVAKAVGCSQPHLWQLEHGRVDPNLSLAAKLMEFLSIDQRTVFAVPKRRRRAA